MCHHGLSIRQPCTRCADEYHRLMKIDTVEPVTWVSDDGYRTARTETGARVVVAW